MTETQEVNYEKLGELIEEQIAGGTDAIVICGTTGEASTLSHEEHLDAIKYTVEKVKSQNPGNCRNRLQQHGDSNLSVSGSRKIRRGRTSSRFSVLQ